MDTTTIWGDISLWVYDCLSEEAAEHASNRSRIAQDERKQAEADWKSSREYLDAGATKIVA